MFLDVGCCLAQDQRQLVLDSIYSDRCRYRAKVPGPWVSSISTREHLKEHFRCGQCPPFDIKVIFTGIIEKIEVICVASFLHLFDWDHPVSDAVRIVCLLKPQPGSLFLGRYDLLRNVQQRFHQVLRGFLGGSRSDDRHAVEGRGELR